MRFDSYFEVPRQNKGGGLLLLWNSDLDVFILGYGGRHIDSIMRRIEFGTFRVIGFYWNPDSMLRKESWELLRRLSHGNHLSSVVYGDFNEVTY